MRRALQIALFWVFVISAVVALLIGYLSVDWLTVQFIEREIAATNGAIHRKFRAFDVLLENEEVRMDQRLQTALPAVARELLSDPPSSFEGRSVGQIAELSRRAGVDNIYIIDDRTVVVATDFPPDKGFELGQISPEIRALLTGLVGTGRFVVDRINMSSKTGLLLKYGYYSPPGSAYVAEASIDVRKFLARERSQAFVDFLFGSFFRELTETNEYLKAIDINMVNAFGRFSLFDRESQLPAAMAERLDRQDHVIEKQGALWKAYSKLSPVSSRLSTANYLAIAATYDFDALAKKVRILVVFIVGMMILSSALAYLAAVRIAARRIIERVEAIRDGVSRIAEGDYSRQLAVAGKDEINDIADDINVMRAKIAADFGRREADAIRLAQARAEAEAANQAKTQFLSSVSHELRTPLHAITGYAQLMKREADTADAATGTKRLERILKAGAQLTRMINNILDVSQAEKGTLSVRIAPIAPGPIIAEAIELMEPNAAAKFIEIRNLVASATLPRIEADPNRLSQVLLNLLANSVKYGDKGGRIDVDARIASGGRLKILIADSGPGIPADKIGELFRWFDRLGRETGAADGIGIGLALSHDLVTRMNGTIGFENLPERGCLFWFELPLAQEAAAAAAPAPERGADTAPRAQLPGPTTVLYVEDSLDLQELMEAILSTHSACRLIKAVNAEDGLKLAEERRPDVILMDINLPGMNGIAASRRLRENAATSDIPVIAVTGAAMQHDIDKARAGAFFAYLTKPYGIDEVMGAIAAALQARAKAG